MIRLKNTPDKFYQGHAKYVVSYDHAAGRDDRYHVWLLNSGDPVTIGRELDLPIVRGLIEEYEAYFTDRMKAGLAPYYGYRRSALAALRAISAARLARSTITLKGPTPPAKLVKQIVRQSDRLKRLAAARPGMGKQNPR